MKTISNDDLKEILRKHVLWVMEDPKGERANLREAYLEGAKLCKAILIGANLREAYLEGADLTGADLTGANLREAYLEGADLTGANLYEADLSGANLSGANLREASLIGANLYEAYLRGANLREANIDWPLVCPEKGSFIGYKKCRNNLIVKLEIPADALRSSATTRKCRCSKAKVVSITNLNGSKSECTEATSKKDSSFVYKVGETVEVPDFDPNRFNECAPGIHFFVTRQEAESYIY